jgi:hypothetical protein
MPFRPCVHGNGKQVKTGLYGGGQKRRTRMSRAALICADPQLEIFIKVGVGQPKR